MPANLNPRVVELLTWHGHAGGGVHVPFQSTSNPIGETIDTSLISRLRALAASIAANPASSPRWIFLVGGPGNGKSETVQDFLVHLDTALGMNGVLRQQLADHYSRPGLLPRKVEVLSAHLGSAAGNFATHVGRLVIVQDATATENALGNAAQELARDLADLMTTPESPPMPVFVACANRGLLARAMNEAFHEFGQDNEVTKLLANVIQASSLGRETLAGRKPCWPLEADPRFACWPLDVESLLVETPPATRPLETMLLRAVDANHWETPGRCQDCVSRQLCPLRQNAEWLRDDAYRGNLLTLLRRGELARGQRWNFRDAFSLIAELLVGQWSDFDGLSHPCEWVHREVAATGHVPPIPGSVVALTMQLYPHAMFKGGHTKTASAFFLEGGNVNPQSQPLTATVLASIASAGEGESTKPIREMLARDYGRLDPAMSTPTEASHPLRPLEDAFCQSVEQGRAAAHALASAPIEDALLDLFERAEGEWDVLGRDSKVAITAVCMLRKMAGMITKRSAGVRLGRHSLDNLLKDYEACLHDRAQLATVRNALQPLLGETSFRFNLVEVLGQPRAEAQPLISLEGPAPGARPLPAPAATASAPGHDVPCLEVTDPNYRIPLTFDFYLALRLRKDGCAGSSLPASVRAALDRLRHRYAGELCRKEEQFVYGRAFISLGAGKTVGVAAPGAAPTLTQN
jgi:hypothetical protein